MRDWTDENVHSLQFRLASLCKSLDTREVRHVKLPHLEPTFTIDAGRCGDRCRSRLASFGASHGEYQPRRVHRSQVTGAFQADTPICPKTESQYKAYTSMSVEC